MSAKDKPTISINQAKIIYTLANYDKSDFGVGDFGTDLESFQPVADAIDDLKERGFITASEWHHESRNGGRQRDKIIKCRLTEKGTDELGKVTGDFLNSEGEFDLEKWQ